MTQEHLKNQLADITARMNQGEFEAARHLLRELVDAHPASAAAWKALGVAENKLGRAEPAERCLREALRLDASDPDAWSSLGGVYVALGRHADALGAFEHALALDPIDTYSMLNMLAMTALVGDFDAARRRFSDALSEGQRRCEAQIANGENLPWSCYDLAQIHFLEGRDAEFSSALGSAIAASNGWQVATARKTYELLAGSGALEVAAARALAEFVRVERERTTGG